MTAWTEEGEKLAKSLQEIEDESKIKALCEEVVGRITIQYPNPTSRRNPLADVRKTVAAKYPATHSQQANYQYFTNGGKGKKARWEHLALKYLTLSERDWNELGDNNRAEWKAMQEAETKLQTKSKAKPETKLQTKSKAKPKAELETTKKLLQTMTVQDLELDTETQAILEDAIVQSGMSLADFIKQSVRVYAKTISGKKRQLTESLVSISTDKLLNDPAYSTHPGRADELVKRAIRAIKIYNDEVATESKQRWIITASLLYQLTGSRVTKINEILATCKDDIDSHHAKYPDFFEEEGKLKQYFNRKRGVDAEDEINLIERVPYGQD